MVITERISIGEGLDTDLALDAVRQAVDAQLGQYGEMIFTYGDKIVSVYRRLFGYEVLPVEVVEDWSSVVAMNTRTSDLFVKYKDSSSGTVKHWETVSNVYRWLSAVAGIMETTENDNEVFLSEPDSDAHAWVYRTGGDLPCLYVYDLVPQELE